MTSASETLIELSKNYMEISDPTGRIFKIKLLNSLDRLRLLKAAGPELAHNEAWLNVAALAVSVSEINGIPRVVPSNERQIEAAVLELGDIGLQTIASALDSELTTLADQAGKSLGNLDGTPI